MDGKKQELNGKKDIQAVKSLLKRTTNTELKKDLKKKLAILEENKTVDK